MAEHHVLGGAAAEQHRHLVLQLLARHEEAVLGRTLDGVAERADAARDDRDLVHRVDPGKGHRHHGVAELVVRDDAPLPLVEDAVLLLQPGDDALDGVGEVLQRHVLAAAARGEQRRLVDEVGEVGAGEARGEGGHLRQIYIVP